MVKPIFSTPFKYQIVVLTIYFIYLRPYKQHKCTVNPLLHGRLYRPETSALIGGKLNFFIFFSSLGYPQQKVKNLQVWVAFRYFE